jgi:hypothetical protein
MIRTTKPIACTAYDTAYEVHPDFSLVSDTIQAMIDRITVQLNYLRNSGIRVKSVKITDAKERACEIRGMIALLASVCECTTLVDALLNELDHALITALACLRK